MVRFTATLMTMAKASGESVRRIAGAAALVVLLSGCGVADGLDRLQETIDETLDETEPPPAPTTGTAADSSPRNEWAEYASETGYFTVDLPAEPEYVEVEQDGLTIGGWSTKAESNGYGIGEYLLEPGITYDIDVGMIGAVERVIDEIEVQLSRSATYEIVDQSSNVLDGHEGVRFVAAVAVEDDDYATVHGAVYETDETVVLLTMIDIDGDDTADAERFINSLQLSP